MTMTFIILAALALALGLRHATGFRAQRPQHYVASTPVFDVREILKGPMLCEGVILVPLAGSAPALSLRCLQNGRATKVV